MADLHEFADEGFNAKAWINQACLQRPSEEPAERYLAELEMRLQLTAEEIESTLQEHCNQAMRRIPFAVQEIYRLQGDIQGMQDQVKVLTTQVQRDAADATDAVSPISKLDKVKRNMEAACSTLKEATELSGLFIKVEEVFSAGDLPRVADILSSMRKSLRQVGDVPEFRAGRQRLKTLEDRLQGMIEGSLADALALGTDEENIKKLCGLLLAVDRFSTIRDLYITSRLAQIHKIWEELSTSASAQAGMPPAASSSAGGAAAAAAAAAGAGAKDALAWLLQFYVRLLAYLEQEQRWCERLLPAQKAGLLTALLKAVFTKVSKGVREQLTDVTSLAALTALQRDVTTFAHGVANLIKDLDAKECRDVLHLVFEPLEEKVSAYGSLEKAQLHAELAILQLPDASAPVEDMDGLVWRLMNTLKQACGALHGAVDCCMAFTSGTELKALTRVVDSELSKFVHQLQVIIEALHRKAAAGAVGGDAAGAAGYAEDLEEVSSILRLLLLSADLSKQLQKLEAQIRATISMALPKLEAAAAKSSAPATAADPVVVRLALAPQRLVRVQQLGNSLSDPRFILLPEASAAMDSLVKAVAATVFDVLLAKVKVQLQPVAEMAEWRRPGGATPLPSFSVFASAYITAIGEYLMTMPQQLEVLMTEENEDSDVEELAAQWLDKSVSGAASLYVEHILKIPELTVHGGMQLSVDVEYFCNVMSALQVLPPASLLTVQLFAGQPDVRFMEAAREAAAEGSVDMSTLRALANMRKVSLEV